MDDMDTTQDVHDNEFRARFGEWIECGKCRALMYDTFVKCWSCGIDLTDKNKVAVRL